MWLILHGKNTDILTLNEKVYHYVGNEDRMADDFNLKLERDWFERICSPSELERILNVQNANDYILRLRAETIADDIRLYRVFLHKVHYCEANGLQWELEKYFKTDVYNDVLQRLNGENRELCSRVSCGAIISNDPNGLIFETDYGVCSTYSTVLKQFTRYSLLALLQLGDKVPMGVRIQAIRIAIRVMLQKESLDFDVDPRGIIPKNIDEAINAIYALQLDFLAAHEYSHFINGDMKKGIIAKQAVLKAHFKDQTDYKMMNAYNTDQKNEFKADIGAMTYPLWEEVRYNDYYYATMMWFASLAIYEAAENTVFPPIGRQSHPGAKARYLNLLENAPHPKDFDKKLYYETIPQLVSSWEDFAMKDISLNFDGYEMYGATYLAKPNTEWRGRELVDRVDY